MGELLLIKHAPPEITPEVISHRWVLSADGQARCDWLAGFCRARDVARIFASPEPKTLETAALIAMALGLPFRPLNGLQENDRSGLGFVSPSTLEARIKTFFQNPDEVSMGGESARAVVTRFRAAIEIATRDAEDGVIAVVTHGTAMSAFIAAHNAVDPMAVWRGLTLPCVVRLQTPSFRMLQDPIQYLGAPNP